VDGRKALEVQVDPRTAPVVPPAPPALALRGDQLPGWAAAAAGLLGPAVAAVSWALEPAPANADAAAPVVTVVLGYALLVAWLGAAAAAIARRPVALGWATAVPGLSVLMTITCPTSGHHSAVAGWWVAELVVCLSALALSAAGLRWWAGRRAAA
jgi:hypothetical protein